MGSPVRSPSHATSQAPDLVESAFGSCSEFHLHFSSFMSGRVRARVHGACAGTNVATYECGDHRRSPGANLRAISEQSPSNVRASSEQCPVGSAGSLGHARKARKRRRSQVNRAQSGCLGIHEASKWCSAGMHLRDRLPSTSSSQCGTAPLSSLAVGYSLCYTAAQPIDTARFITHLETHTDGHEIRPRGSS